MTVTAPTYCTREAVKAALDVKVTARSDSQIDRIIESVVGDVEGLLQRRFYPEQDTRYFDWPSRQYSRPWRVWLDRHEVISVSTLTAGGTTIAASDYFLEPANTGPPYNHIEIDLSSTAAFAAGDTHQRAIAVTGLFGYRDDAATTGALDAAVSTTSTTSVDVTDVSDIGIGNLIAVDSERMLVTAKTMIDTTQNIGGSLTAARNDETVAVTDGTAYTVGEVILVDSERMLIVDVSGNNLTVKRSWDGTTLAAHTSGADIYAPRRLTVTRGAVGTTAATHDNGTAITRHVIPGLVEELAVAEAVNRVLQRSTGYSRIVGAGDNQREASGRGLRDIRRNALTQHGRKARKRAI